MTGIKRASTPTIQYLLHHFPCVAILGSRQVGKTTLLKQVLPDAPFFDLEKQADINRISHDPDFFLSQYQKPIIIDEAQTLPAIFSALRIAIDNQRNKNGRSLISGSASPDLLKHITESLAGRIAVFELSGFSLEESWRQPKNSLYQDIANHNIEKLLEIKPHLTTQQLLDSCLFGSYPEPFLKHRNDSHLFHVWMDNYFQTYINRDIRGLFPGLNIQNYQRFVAMLAGSSGQLLNVSEFARSLDVSQPTAKLYFQIAHGTFFWRMIPSYQKAIKKRVIKMPKGHMRDSGLLNYLIKNHTTDALQTHPLYGRIWETFIIEELLKGFQNNLISVLPFFYRTQNQAEIDLILETQNSIIPIEIKSGSMTKQKSIIALEKFVKDHTLPFGVVINHSSEVIWLSKNILQIPAGCL